MLHPPTFSDALDQMIGAELYRRGIDGDRLVRAVKAVRDAKGPGITMAEAVETGYAFALENMTPMHRRRVEAMQKTDRELLTEIYVKVMSYE